MSDAQSHIRNSLQKSDLSSQGGANAHMDILRTRVRVLTSTTNNLCSSNLVDPASNQPNKCNPRTVKPYVKPCRMRLLNNSTPGHPALEEVHVVLQMEERPHTHTHTLLLLPTFIGE